MESDMSLHKYISNMKSNNYITTVINTGVINIFEYKLILNIETFHHYWTKPCNFNEYSQNVNRHHTLSHKHFGSNVNFIHVQVTGKNQVSHAQSYIYI